MASARFMFCLKTNRTPISNKAHMTRKLKTEIRLTPVQVRAFRNKIYLHYRSRGRDLPWRNTNNPYHILVSEIMLQQTQVERVLAKYHEFLQVFPDFASLANARLPKLLKLWSGMGYNRRALALRSLARIVVDEHSGVLPSDHEKLTALPGIGNYTASAVLSFAFNKPVVFMDTNIRRVYIFEFFHDRKNIHDDEIRPLIERTMNVRNPGKWYNALMDYGAMIKREYSNPNRRSAHYSRQDPFLNSDRQVRGTILKVLLKKLCLSKAAITRETGMDTERINKNLVQLEKEGFIRKKGRNFRIASMVN